MTRLGIPVEAQVEILKHTENNFPDVKSIVYFERDLNYFKARKWMTKQVAVLMEKKIQQFSWHCIIDKHILQNN